MKGDGLAGLLMGLLWSLLGRPLVAIQDSEKAHGRAISGLRIVHRIPPLRFLLRITCRPKDLPTRLLEWDLANPLGLAAGMDKKAENIEGWDALGFGQAGVTLFSSVNCSQAAVR